MTTHFEQLVPSSAGPLSDEQILASYTSPALPWLRVNFISSIDGASTRNGRSGGLGDASDRRVFGLLRRLADVVIVGAGTIRDEGYGGFRLEHQDAEWRREQAMPQHPTLAIVSGSLNLDPRAAVFSDAPVRPLVYTVEAAAAEQRARLEEVADVVSVGAATIDPVALRDDLVARGLPRMHCEGGPKLFGALIAADLVDELCLTVAPSLESGEAARIAHSAIGSPLAMHLTAVHCAEDELFLRYVRSR